MVCPSCGQQPMSQFRYNFSISRGVGITRALKGYLKCQNCQTLLRAGSYGRIFWSFVISLVVLIALFGVLFQRISSATGATSAAILFILLLLATGSAANYLGWKHIRYNKADITA